MSQDKLVFHHREPERKENLPFGSLKADLRTAQKYKGMETTNRHETFFSLKRINVLALHKES